MPTSAVLMVPVPASSRPQGSGRLMICTLKMKRLQRDLLSSLLGMLRTIVSTGLGTHMGYGRWPRGALEPRGGDCRGIPRLSEVG